MISIGPLVFGIPHLVSDLRYLVVKPEWHKHVAFWILVALPLLLASYPPLHFLAPLAWIGACAGARASLPFRAVACIVAIAFAALYWRGGNLSILIFAHAHNFVAAAIALFVFSRSRTHTAIPLGVFLLFSIALTAGAFDPLLHAKEALSPIAQGATFESATRDYASQLMPFVSPSDRTTWALRLISLFVFAQGIHYVVWLRIVPDEARSREGIRSFYSSFQALASETGMLFILVAVGLWLIFAVWGVFAAESARLGYLYVAAFHGHLEIAFIALFLLEGAVLTRARRLPA